VRTRTKAQVTPSSFGTASSGFSRASSTSLLDNRSQFDLTPYPDGPDTERNAGYISPTDFSKKGPPQDFFIAESSSKHRRRPTQKAREMEADIDDE
jgi:hypothetical protein